ncbi:threonine aldolase family protein [Lacunimicrobium album]
MAPTSTLSAADTVTNTTHKTPDINLRSDTETKPTPAMREAIFHAVVGDDMVGEDPTTNRLEAMVAEMCGMEAAVFAPSGTMTNQLAVKVHCQPGDELYIEEYGHIANYEAGGPALLSGVTCKHVKGSFGMLDVEELEKAWRPPSIHFPTPRLLCLENTTNIGGGKAYPLDQYLRVCEWGRNRGLKLHLDGARVFNAVVARGYTLRDICDPLDSISICLSKGLGCPVGSILVGNKEDMQKARRFRKVFGGAMRQVGILAAAAIYALENHVDRLADDHKLAKVVAQGLATVPGLKINVDDVETNIIFFEVDPTVGSATDFVAQMSNHGLHFYAMGRQRIRALTHLDVNATQIQQALEIVRRETPHIRQNQSPTSASY